MSIVFRTQRLLFKPYHRFLWWLSTKPGICQAPGLTNGGDCDMLLVTIAYNSSELIDWQIRLLKKNVTDRNYRILIVDNSTQLNQRKAIRTVCEHHQVDYVEVPRWIGRLVFTKLFWYGNSHGVALNWIYYHVLLTCRTKRIALLDHDLFPIHQVNLTETLGQRSFYGVARKRDAYWYVWPGYVLFNAEALSKVAPDFLPVFENNVYLDAGGGMYRRWYSHFDEMDIDFAQVETKRVQQSPELKSHDDIYHGDCVQMIDGTWLHLVNGSNYSKIVATQKKLDWMRERMLK